MKVFPNTPSSVTIVSQPPEATSGSHLLELSQYLATMTMRNLSDDVIGQVKLALADAVGAMVAGSQSTHGMATVEASLAMGGSGRATVVGTDVQLSVSEAAMCNGTFAHALELDDFGGCGHSGAVVVPAALATAQVRQASGTALLEAIICGYEAAARVTEAVGGYRAHNDRGWHSTGTCGVFGAAAAAARLLDADAGVLADALGLAGSYAGGLWNFIHDGSFAKRMHAGKASAGGVSAAYLAQQGCSGPRKLFEDTWASFVNVYGEGTASVGALTDGLGDVHDMRILRSGFKPYPTCRGAHSAMEAIYRAKEEPQFKTDNVAVVLVRLSAASYRQLGNADIRTQLDAQMSLPYCIAVALMYEHPQVEHFDPQGLAYGDVRKMMKRVTMRIDFSLSANERPWVKIRMADNAEFNFHIEEAVGGPTRPMTPGQFRSKFSRAVEPVIGQERSAEAWDAIQNIEDAVDISGLLAPLTAPPKDAVS